ncbi:MAG: thioredoxin fold domain-containing protein [Deltaproteobacteria bacterium]|nr:thioredoxin fold domain-containing protein [Deltaproteobacteria bacterium]
MEKIEWSADITGAHARSTAENKPLFLFFCSPGCYFCQKMEMDAYTHDKVVALFGKGLRSVRISPDNPVWFKRYHVKFTPTCLLLNPEGNEAERLIGFLEPDGLMAFLLLGLSKAYYDMGCLEEGRECVETLTRDYPESAQAPEGFFLRGIYRYHADEDREHFKEAFEILQERYRDSIWVKRARLLYLYPCGLFRWQTYRQQKGDFWDKDD